MAEVAWAGLSPQMFEDMVGVLLSHMNPDTRRIDGSGGDGGRDAEFSRETGPEIFQLKSFTGRMHPARRKKVKASLAKAAKRSPVAWHLVVPIDPTPGEGEWFEKLEAEYPFPLSWKGKTWLNGQMAERAFIPRYFLSDERDKVIEMLTQLQEEKAALTDIRDGMERMRRLAARINEIDPYYRFDVAVRDGTVEIEVIPRYEGAELDRPLTINLGLNFPDSDDGRAAAEEFQAAMDFGSSVEVEARYIESLHIDAPAGIGGSLPLAGALTMGPPQPAEDWRMKIVLRAVDAQDIAVAELPMTLTERTLGRRGFIVRGTDRPGVFAVEMRTDIQTRRVKLNFRFSATAEHFPHDLLPALMFMRGVKSPNKVQVLVGDEKVRLGESIDSPNVGPIEPEYVQLVDDLARVQRETGTFFPMPPQLSHEDLLQLAEVVALLDGEEVTQTWSEVSIGLHVTDPGRFLNEVTSKAEGASFLIEGETSVTIAGNTMPLRRLRTHLPEARIANLEELKEQVEAAASDEELAVELRLEALGDKTLRRSIVTG